MDGLGNFREVGAGIGQMQARFPRTPEFRNGPFRFVDDFPREQRRMRTAAGFLLANELFLYRFVRSDLSVADEDAAVRVLRDVVLVRDQNDGVALAVQVGEKGHDFLAGA